MYFSSVGAASAISHSSLQVVKEYPTDGITVYSSPQGVPTFSLHLETDREGRPMAPEQEALYYLARRYAQVAQRDRIAFSRTVQESTTLEDLKKREQAALANIVAYKSDYKDYHKNRETAESCSDQKTKDRQGAAHYAAFISLKFRENSPITRPNPLILMTVRNLIEQHKTNGKIDKTIGF